MRGPLVLDASVVLKLVISEAYSEESFALIDHAAANLRPIVGPPLLPIEVTNAIYQRFRRGDLTVSEATAALREVETYQIIPVPVADLHERAFAFASEHGLPNIYDCVYVVLAEREGAELWTADARLLRAMTGAAPWVRWIGDIQMGME